MDVEVAVLSAEQSFFSALVSADTSALEHLLAGDFVIIDVMRGAEFSKNDLVGAIAAGMVRFAEIERGERTGGQRRRALWPDGGSDRPDTHVDGVWPGCGSREQPVYPRVRSAGGGLALRERPGYADRGVR